MGLETLAGRITAEWRVSEVIRRYPGTGPIFLQHGRMFVPRPGDPSANYPGLTIEEYAVRNGIDVALLLGLVNAAAEVEGAGTTASGRAPVTGPIGYTGTYRESDPDIDDLSPVTALEARGPE